METQLQMTMHGMAYSSPYKWFGNESVAKKSATGIIHLQKFQRMTLAFVIELAY
jgi:hypothetical protein